jgi:MFS family permease
MEKNELKLLWPFYFTALTASSLSVALPVWIVFLQKEFSFLQISFAVSLQSIAAILFEIPTGALADAFGRKISVVLGIVLQGLLWLALPFIHWEILLYVTFFLMGLLRTLESGADKAWVIDWLEDNNGGSLIQGMFIRIQSLRSVGSVISSLLATLLLFYVDISYLFLVQGSGYIFESVCLFIFAKENVHEGERRLIGSLFRDTLHTAKRGFSFLLDSKSLRCFVVATTFAVCTKDFGCLAWQPLLVNLSLPAEQLGAVFSTCSLIGIVTPFFAKKLLARIGQEKHYLSFTTFVEFILLASLYFVAEPFFPLGILVYLSVNIISDLQSPVGSLYFQSLIPSKIRATMGSVQSMIFAIFSLIVTSIGGYSMDKQGPRMTVVYFSFFLIPATVFYLMIRSKPDHPLSGMPR